MSNVATMDISQCVSHASYRSTQLFTTQNKHMQTLWSTLGPERPAVCSMFTGHRRHVSVSSHLMVWLKEALRIWLLSLEKLRQVTPLLWACSNLRRHKPLWIFHTFRNNNTHTRTFWERRCNETTTCITLLTFQYFDVFASSFPYSDKKTSDY